MSDCLECKKKDKEIAELKGLVEFHKREHESWRQLFNEQRGGETYNQLQRDYADAVAECKRNMSNYLEHVHDISIKHDAEVEDLKKLIELAWYVRQENAHNYIAPEWSKEKRLGEVFWEYETCPAHGLVGCCACDEARGGLKG